MRLVTIQPYEVLEILQSRGRFVCDISKSGMIVDGDCGFLAAYDWLVSQMEKRVGTAPIGVEYPIWAWYRNDDDYSDWNEDGRKYAKITLEIDPSRVLLSDFNEWHCVLNDCPLLDENLSEEEFEAEWDRCVAAGPEAVRATWERIFHNDGGCVQATFWELRLEDVVKVEVFTSRKRDEAELE